MIALNSTIALDGKALSNEHTVDQVRDMFGRLSEQSQGKLIDALREMKTLGLLPHHALLGENEPEAKDKRKAAPAITIQRGGIFSVESDDAPGLVGLTQKTNGESPTTGLQPEPSGGLNGAGGQQPSQEEILRAQASFLLNLLVTEDRNHKNLDLRVMSDLRDNASLLTLMHDLAELASKEHAGGLGIGLEVADAGKFPRACELHPMPCPDARPEHRERSAEVVAQR